MTFPQFGAALSLEASAVVLALRTANSLPAYYGFLMVHALASAIFVLAVYPFLPSRYAQPRKVVLLLLFAWTFFIPILGLLALGAAVLVMRLLPLRPLLTPFRVATTPELPQTARGPRRSGFRELSVRPLLANTGLPVAVRAPALNALTTMPVRVAGELLHRLLADPAEELRLVAHGLLDNREKELRQRIDAQEAMLAEIEGKAGEDSEPLNPTLLVLRLRALAELNFELVYQRLVQGDVRAHALEQALQQADAAIDLAGAEPGLLQLRARIHLESGEQQRAREDLDQALEAGAPPVRVLPYLAEIAYQERDWPLVRQLLGRLQGLPTSSRVAALVRYWSLQDADAAGSEGRT